MLHAALSLSLLFLSIDHAAAFNATAFDRYQPAVKAFSKGANYRSAAARFGGHIPPRSKGTKRQQCDQDGALEGFGGHWGLHKSTAQYFYEPDACQLRRFSHAEAVQCLAGKRIGFAGDSVSRQHFTTLVTWIATGYLPQPYDDAYFSPTNAYKWPSWDSFFDGLQRRVLRGPNGKRPNVRFSLQMPDGDSDVKSKRMHLAIHHLAPHNQSLYIDYCFAGIKPDWVGAATGSLDNLFSDEVDQPPDYVVFNMGAWWGRTGQDDPALYAAMSRIFAHGSRLAQQRGRDTAFFWRSTMMDKWTAKNKRVGELAQAEGWRVLDTLPMFAAMRIQQLWLNMRRTDDRLDSLHFLPIMYEQMIDMLLNRICL